MAEMILEALNLLLLPVFGLLMRINAEIASLKTSVMQHSKRLDKIESMI